MTKTTKFLPAIIRGIENSKSETASVKWAEFTNTKGEAALINVHTVMCLVAADNPRKDNTRVVFITDAFMDVLETFEEAAIALRNAT